MYKKILNFIILFLLFSFTASPVYSASCTTTLTAVDDIQTAIDDPLLFGDVICLSPGVYSPTATININRSVTLQGLVQAGVDPRPAGLLRTPGDGSEAIIDGSVHSLIEVILITADNVILDGLEVTNGTGDLIHSVLATPTYGTILRYNIIHDGGKGVQLRDVKNALIEFNYIFTITQDAINVCCRSDSVTEATGATIRLNEVSSANTAINNEAPFTSIKCNDVDNDVDNVNYGIKVGSTAVGGKILYNNVSYTTQDGISIYSGNTLVEGNNVSNSSGNSAIYVANSVSGITITKNDIHDSLNPGNGAIMIGPGVNALRVVVNNNNITGNTPYGVTNNAVDELDAEYNWWGVGVVPSTAVSGNVNVDFPLTAPETIISPCDMDFCENAQLIGIAINNPFKGTTTGANPDESFDYCLPAGESNSADGVWFKVTGTGAKMTAKTCSPYTDYDTKISVYEGGCDSDIASCVGGNDDSFNCPYNPLTSTFSWVTVALQEYLILVHGFSENTGNFELTISEGAPQLCGDGFCDGGGIEDCISCPSDCITSGGAVAICDNGVCETSLGENCRNCPSDCAGQLTGKPSTRFCCGDDDGVAPNGCEDLLCTSDPFDCTDAYTVPDSFCCGDGSCDPEENIVNCWIDCVVVPSCPDGICSGLENQCDCPSDCGAPPPGPETSCDDDFDNDCDGHIDCNDSDCDPDPACQVDCSSYIDKQPCNDDPNCRWNNRDKNCIPK